MELEVYRRVIIKETRFLLFIIEMLCFLNNSRTLLLTTMLILIHIHVKIE